MKNLEVFYGMLHALKDVSLDIREGQLVAVIGANGAGKSTLLKSIIGLLKPKSGKIEFKGEDITSVPPWNRVRRGIVMVPEARRLFPYLTVMQNLWMGAYPRSDKPEIQRDFGRVFKLFHILKERENQMARTLSGGEGQMLAIGRGLMSKPELLMMDEPSMGLMPRLVDEVFETIKSLHDQGITVLLVEQNARKALAIADKGYVLENGRIVLSGDAGELEANPGVREAYLGG